MLNDLIDWAVEKTDQGKQVAEGVANEVTTTGVMEWSTTVWIVIGVVVAIVILGIANNN